MKKQLAVVLTILLVCTFLIHGNTYRIFAEDENTMSKKTLNQGKSMRAYNELLDAEKGKLDDSEVIGATYIDDDGYLCIGVTNTAKKSDILPKSSYRGNIVFKDVAYSLSELNALKEEVSTDILSNKNVSNLFKSIHIKHSLNSIVLVVSDLEQVLECIDLEKYDSDMLIVNESKEDVVEVATDIINGERIEIDGSGCSAGFGATKRVWRGVWLTINGVVSTGHTTDIDIGDTCEDDNTGNAIGTVLVYQNSGDTDASFIETNSSYNGSNETIRSEDIKAKSSAIEGLDVKFYGQKSNTKYGEINVVGVQSGNNTDCIEVNFSLIGGDSGGPLVYYDSTVNGDILIGIAESTISSASYYVQVNNIFDDLVLYQLITN